ncbi:MAG: M28 family metallopeptidase [Sporichthyaceae bacterium]|nr:M28 family metallopeptidase [Sporichthyaceae bacterium]
MRAREAILIRAASAGLGLALLVGCSGAGSDSAAGTGLSPSGSPSSSPPAPTPSPTTSATPPVGPTGPARVAVDVDAVVATIRTLSERIGPREATSAAYREAATLAADRLDDLGYRVRRQSLQVPAGVSWGVPVRAGRTHNVIAEPVGFEPSEPHLVVGAHLDTVPQAPGAEDNGSGVAVLLEAARIVAQAPPAVPVVFIAFGAEEPRGDGDDRHHYGSRAYVADLSSAVRAALIGMISLDRVGVGSRVPICTGGRSPRTVADRLARVAQRLDIPVRRCFDNRSSDHWSFERAGLTAARIGSTPYPEYHSAEDRIGVVELRQLARVARLLTETLRTWPAG